MIEWIRGEDNCLLITIHEATCGGYRALSKPMWNPANITDMMSDDLDITEAVVLDHITAILYIGHKLVGEGLTKEEAQACIEHFSPYIISSGEMWLLNESSKP